MHRRDRRKSGLVSLLTATCLVVVQLRAGGNSAHAAATTTRAASRPAESPASQDPASPRLGLTTSVGLGAAYSALTAAQDGQARHSFGVALDGRLGYRFLPWFGINLSLSWTLTHWHRVRDMAEWGVAAFNWSKGSVGSVAGAYEKVNNWVGNGGDTEGLRVMGAFFAYLGITVVLIIVALGVVFGPLVVVLSPLAATDMVLGAATATFFWPAPVEPFAEAGVGGGLLMHPITNDAMAGWGPVVGAGLRWKRYGIGLRFFWSPPDAQTEPENVSTNAFAGLLTLKICSK